jgi:hypothetical protein
VNERKWPSFAAWKIYVFLAIPATILLNLSFPNFHAPDDYDHVKRAYTLVHEPFRTITPEGSSTGAMIDSGLTKYIDAQIPLVKSRRAFNPEQRRTLQLAHQIQWSGTQTFSEMPGALSYFPLLYAPQTAMLEIGRLAGASVETSVLWARLANGLASIALTAIGLYFLRGGQAIALFLLLLPRTLLQFASNSADPILYGLALIIIALGLRTAGSDRLRSGVIAVALFISGTVRPPITALALAPAVEALRKRQWLNIATLSAACVAAAIWVMAILPSITERRCGDVGTLGPKLQTFALQWPLLIGSSFEQRAGYYYVSLVGHYGWGDGRTGIIGTPMPTWVYLTALPLFVIALCRDLFAPFQLSAILRISLVVGGFCSVWLTFLAMYVSCTVPGEAVIAGVQGRYFVTALFAIAPAVGGLLARARPHVLERVYPPLITGWTVACTATMLISSPQLYTSLR